MVVDRACQQFQHRGGHLIKNAIDNDFAEVVPLRRAGWRGDGSVNATHFTILRAYGRYRFLWTTSAMPDGTAASPRRVRRWGAIAMAHCPVAPLNGSTIVVDGEVVLVFTFSNYGATRRYYVVHVLS